MNYKELERELTPMSNEPIRDMIRDRAARTLWAAYRAHWGYSTTSNLLSNDVQKMGKNQRPTWSLNLAHHDTSGINVCPWEDQCAAHCVGTSGMARYDSVQRSRRCTTSFLVNYPEVFAYILTMELDKIRAQYGPEVSIRLNAYSDIRWERVAPWIFTRYADVSFYDYTKHPVRSRPNVPTNYRLTYSVSPRTTATELDRQLALGRNPAVVVDVRHGDIPTEWHGLPTVYGDKTDARDMDPVGVAVILRRKNTLKAGDGLTVHPKIATK